MYITYETNLRDYDSCVAENDHFNDTIIIKRSVKEIFLATGVNLPQEVENSIIEHDLSHPRNCGAEPSVRDVLLGGF
jgi:hypothetical protein